MTPEAIAEAVWEYATRTTTSGTPDAPADYAEEIAEAVWEYSTRTLTAGGGGATEFPFEIYYQSAMGV